MQDIRLVDNDGEYLNLETQGGEKFRLVLDDSLRSAIKRDASNQLDTVSISPREIQDEVRAGATAEEVAEKHSVPLDYVEKFALTVVDEIGHIIASAQTVRISVEADRYSEATQVEFGEILEGRLKRAGAKNVVWSATKVEGSPWVVSVSYELSEGGKSAAWSFDQRKLVLSPENEAAVKMSAGDFSGNTSSPKLKQVEPSTENTKIIELPRVDLEAEVIDTPIVVPVPEVTTVSSIEELTRSSLQAVEEVAQAQAPEELSPTADLLEALRKKRAAASSHVEGIVDSAPASVTEGATEPALVKEAAQEQDAAPIAPAAKKGRPSMPSWDEIVFGTKTDD